MFRFQYPEFLLLAIPLGFAFRRWGWSAGPTRWIRGGLLLLLLLALTGPSWNMGGRGIDVIVVADRSRSMPTGSQENIRELIQNLERNRSSGDRVGIVTIGVDPQVERVLSGSASLGEYVQEILPDGTDLNEAIAKALNLVDPNRPARIVVLSDGEYNSNSPLSAARRARESGVPVDFRLYERVTVGDTAIRSIELPTNLAPRQPFQFVVWAYSARETTGKLTVLREGQPFATREVQLRHGNNRFEFRDVFEEGGTYNYSARLEVADDPLVENNLGEGVVRVAAGPKILLLNDDGQDGNLARALRAGKIAVDVMPAKNAPITLDQLDRYRAVIVENVPAGDFGRVKMERFAQFVEEFGGGFLLTGGERSFGTGGYFKSPLDPVLPVSMEMREEHRKNRVAMVVALDRSGSMTAPVRGGKQKMDLANLGTAECVKLLSAGDMISVIAVDTSPHIIQPMTTLDEKDAIVSKVLGIKSMGGGIYVYEALVAAGKELEKASHYQTRHIILFSDASDSENPGKYKELLAKYTAAGITVSVIGLGRETDPHGPLLKDVAKEGKGNVMFTEDAEELPRLFTQDAMSIARNTFIKKDETQPNGIPAALLPESRIIGRLGSGEFPAADGYNLSYLKPEATAAVISRDEYSAPWSAVWNRGLGRAAALTMEVDGKYSGRFGRWENYGDFLVTHARWLLGGDNPNQLFVNVEREGQDAVVTVELDPRFARADRAQPPSLAVVPPGHERMEPLRPEFVWVGPDTLQARFRLDRLGTYRTLVKSSNGELTHGPAVTLTYSPEFAPRDQLPGGRETLEEIARLSGGQERSNILEVLANPPRGPKLISLLPWLLGASILLLVLEIAGRRLSLWEGFRQSTTPELALAGHPASGMPIGKSTQRTWLPKWKLWYPGRGKNDAGKGTKSAATTSASGQRSLEDGPKSGGGGTAQEGAGAASMSELMEQAKQRARRRMK